MLPAKSRSDRDCGWSRTRTRVMLRRDGGSASLEFITAGLILLVPLVYLVLTVAAIQAGALAAEGAARQAARVYVTASSDGDARSRAAQAIDFTLADYGIDTARSHVSISCTPAPQNCLARHGFVTVAIEVAVPLPLAPAAVSVDAPLAVRVGSTATQQVSRFGGSG